MNQALWIAKTGLDAQQTKMSNIANNLANSATTGYKRSRAIFEDLLYQNVRQVGAQSSQDTRLPSGLQIGTGVRTVATEKLFTQGNLVQTENLLDMAIQGRGFFQILLPDGTEAYTRDGSFQVDSDGRVVTSNGYEVQPAITVPDGVIAMRVSRDGLVEATLAGQTNPAVLGSIQIADFINPSGLTPRGQNLYVESKASGTPQISTPGLDGLGELSQGALETSNVNVVEELVSMIETQRAYEMNSKSISVSDQMLQYLNNNL